jgi:hypothetical protein
MPATPFPPPATIKKRTAPLPIPPTTPLVEAAKPVPKTRSFPIQPVIKFVRASSPDKMAGYLAAYRMFLNLPQQLIEHSAWKLVDLEQTPITTENDNLALAFVQAAEKVVGRPVPPELKVR